MANLPNCPKCGDEYTYEDGHMFICPMCGNEWTAADAQAAAEAGIIRDANCTAGAAFPSYADGHPASPSACNESDICVSPITSSPTRFLASIRIQASISFYTPLS